jgi:hypothetical protein
MVLVDRDYRIIKDIERFRFCLSRQIKILAGFDGQRACDRRIKALIEAGYINRKKVLYGVPSIYFLTHKGKMLIGANKRQDKIRSERINHDISVVDTAIYFIETNKTDTEHIVTEKELNSKNGFGNRKHYPDFTYEKDNKKYCAEIELTAKSKQRFEQTVKDNYLNYDTQYWCIYKNSTKIKTMLDEFFMSYSNIEVINLEVIEKNAEHKQND